MLRHFRSLQNDYITIEETISLHEKLIEKTGGSHGIRDIGLLESTIYSAESSFDDVEIYPSVEEKAARLFSYSPKAQFKPSTNFISSFDISLSIPYNIIGTILLNR